MKKVAGLSLERIFRRWPRELFFVNQSVLLFSLNSALVSRDDTCLCGNEAPFILAVVFPINMTLLENRVCTDIRLYLLLLLLLRVKR